MEHDIKGEIKVHWFNIFKMLSTDTCLKTFLRIISKSKSAPPTPFSLTLSFLLGWEFNPVFVFYNFIIEVFNFCTQSGTDSSSSTS